jgi:hypothetical protein
MALKMWLAFGGNEDETAVVMSVARQSNLDGQDGKRGGIVNSCYQIRSRTISKIRRRRLHIGQSGTHAASSAVLS